MSTHVWIIGGFLGAGKTTLLMRLAGMLAAGRPRGLAIIANDFSQIGVDQKVLREVHPAVYELFDGCVCCQLSASLVETIGRIQSEVRPDLILIEPSGIAEPARIVDTLRRYSKGLGILRTLVVVDATRLGELLETLEPLMTSQVQAGDILAVNKIDIAGAEDIASVRSAIANLNPNAPVLEISALVPNDVLRVANEMKGFEGPTAQAAKIKFIAPEGILPEQWQEIVSFFVAGIALESARLGATVVGHVKVFASGVNGLRIYCSSTGPQRPPTARRIDEKASETAGVGADGDGKAIIANLNAIVYGLSARELAGAVAKGLSATRERWGLKAEVHNEPENHHHASDENGC